MSPGLFGNMFDLDGDGHLDAFEHAAELMFIDAMEHDRVNDELARAGLDRFSLDMIDEDERRQALEDAGIDPYDYDL